MLTYSKLKGNLIIVILIFKSLITDMVLLILKLIIKKAISLFLLINMCILKVDNKRDDILSWQNLVSQGKESEKSQNT